MYICMRVFIFEIFARWKSTNDAGDLLNNQDCGNLKDRGKTEKVKIFVNYLRLRKLEKIGGIERQKEVFLFFASFEFAKIGKKKKKEKYLNN